jgi:hypothetical protein
VLVIDPEVRLFLTFVDAVGIDFFLLLLTIQGRALFALLFGGVIMPVTDYLTTLGPYPLPLPSRWFVTQHPIWAAYAIAHFLAVVSVIACLVAGALAAGASATTGFIGKALSGSFFAGLRLKEYVLTLRHVSAQRISLPASSRSHLSAVRHFADCGGRRPIERPTERRRRRGAL